MATFVFVHGGWHGAWCWSRVAPLLERQGHNVVAGDLPAHGRDKAITAAVTMKDYVDSTVALVDAQSEPVCLVGHSSGGAIATQVAEHRPDKIHNLVYLAAFLPKNGESIFGLFQQATESVLLRSVVPSSDQTQLTVPEDALRECFYEGCSDEEVALAKFCLVPEPMGPAVTPIETSEKNFGRVRRIYIETLRDKAIPLSFQRHMRSALPCSKTLTMDTDHSPFFSAPDQLVELLTSLETAA
jgi:pimeloyl-ACP methyl ester carboxylesterase